MSGEVIYLCSSSSRVSLDFLWYTQVSQVPTIWQRVPYFSRSPILLDQFGKKFWVVGIYTTRTLAELCMCLHSLATNHYTEEKLWVKVEIQLEFLCKQLCLSLGCCNIVWSLLLFVQNLPNDINVIVFNNKVSDHSNCKQTSD